MDKQQEPRLRFQGFTGEWETEGFESVGEFNPKAEIPQIFQYVDLESVVGTQLISYREEFKETAPSRAQRLAKNGDLFFQAVRPYQKNNYLFEKNNENFVFSTGYIQIRPQNDGYFLLTLVQKEEFVQEVLLRCTGTSYPAINTSSLQNIAILIPQTAEEQSTIGNFFRRLDSQIAESRAVLEKSRQLKKAMLAKMFPTNGEKIPKIRFKGFEGEWEREILKDVVNVFDNLRIPVSENKRTSGNTPYFGANGIQDYVDGFTHNGEFVLIAEDGANDLKNYPVQYVNGKCWVNNHAHVLQGKSEILNNIFLFSRFQSMDISQFLVGGGRAKLNGSTMLEIEIEFPKDKKEQTAIGLFFLQLDETIALQSAEVEKLNQLKKGLLAAMLV
jgi:type I restriction-modification system specificity subunit|nr:restriction endonuclease subunit S [uncultured Neisseria sp.]